MKGYPEGPKCLSPIVWGPSVVMPRLSFIKKLGFPRIFYESLPPILKFQFSKCSNEELSLYSTYSTNVQRIVSGQLTLFGRGTTGKFNVRYTNTPIAYDTTYNVLDTDYDGYAVLYSCSSVIPFGHTDFVWLMTRDRLPAGDVLQRAYGTLDKYKISRTFFVETDQKDCETVAPPIEAYDPTEPSQRSELPKEEGEAAEAKPEDLRKEEEPPKAEEPKAEEKNATE